MGVREEALAKKYFTFSTEQVVFFALWLIIPLSTLTSHTVVPLPPSLLFFVLASGVLFTLVLLKPTIHYTNIVLFCGVWFLYFFISQLMIGAPVVRFVGAIIPMFYFVVVVFFLPYVNEHRRLKLAHHFINLSIAVLILECLWRLTHPDLRYAQFAGGTDIRWIYQYKAAGLMYSDSNAVAIHIVIVLFFIFYLERKGDKKWFIGKLILITLLILTFSRAAWLGGAAGWVYIRYLQGKSIAFFIINGIILAVLVVLAYKFFLKPRIETDLSYQSKFQILTAILNYLETCSLKEFLFGIGFSNSVQRLGVYAHNFFMVYLVESGLFGLIMVCSLFIYFLIIIGRDALFILMPFVFTTLSSTITFIPFFYVVMAFIYVDTKKRQIAELEARDRMNRSYGKS